MLFLALACLILGVILLRAKRPAESPNSSRLYRIDNRVVASVLFILAVAFVALAWTSGRLFV